MDLKQGYNDRGVDVLLITIGRGRSDLESQRVAANDLLLTEGCAADCDALLSTLDRSSWVNPEHLNEEGYKSFGSSIVTLLRCRTSCHSVEPGHQCFRCSPGMQMGSARNHAGF